MVPRSRAQLAMVVVVAIILTACAPATSSPAQPTATQDVETTLAAASPTSSPTDAPRTVRRAPVPLPAIGPSDLVVRVDSLGELCCPSPSVVLTVGGRLVTRAEDGTLVERTLTTAGAQRLRDDVLGTGLFDSDRLVALERAPGATPQPHGISARTFRVWNGARTVTVSSPILWQSEEIFYKPSAARTQLDELAVRLTAPEKWLPASAWVAAGPRPYVAGAYRVVISTEPVGGTQPDVDAIDWPFTTPITDFGEPLAASSQVFVPIGPGTRPLRCAALGADDFRAARTALERAGAAVSDFPDGSFNTGLVWRTAGTGIVLFAQALMPDQSSCGDAY